MRSPLFMLGVIGIAILVVVGFIRTSQYEKYEEAKTIHHSETHVILLLGQSNMSGAATDLDPAIDRGDPRIWQYADGRLVPAVEPLTHWAGVTGGGPGLAFAREYLKSLPANDKIVLVPSAVSGVGFSTPDMGGGELSWDVSKPADPNNVYEQSIRHIKSALAAIEGEKQIDGALVNLGGTDGLNDRPAEEYRHNLVAFIADLRTQLNEPRLPIIIGPSRPDIVATHSGYASITRVQQSVPESIDMVAYIEGANGTEYYIAGDPVHYNMAGHRLMGVRYARALETLKD